MILYYRLPAHCHVALAIYSLLLIFIIKTALQLRSRSSSASPLWNYCSSHSEKPRLRRRKIRRLLSGLFRTLLLTMVLSTQITLTLAGIAG